MLKLGTSKLPASYMSNSSPKQFQSESITPFPQARNLQVSEFWRLLLDPNGFNISLPISGPASTMMRSWSIGSTPGPLGSSRRRTWRRSRSPRSMKGKGERTWSLSLRWWTLVLTLPLMTPSSTAPPSRVMQARSLLLESKP